MSSLNMLQKSLSKDCNVELTIEYSGTLHDREIRSVAQSRRHEVVTCCKCMSKHVHKLLTVLYICRW